MREKKLVHIWNNCSFCVLSLVGVSGVLPNFNKNCHKNSQSWLVVNLKDQE